MRNYIKFLYKAVVFCTITIVASNCGGSGNTIAPKINVPQQDSISQKQVMASTPEVYSNQGSESRIPDASNKESKSTKATTIGPSNPIDGKGVSNNTPFEPNSMDPNAAMEAFMEHTITSTKEKLKTQLSSELNSSKQIDNQFKKFFLKALDEQFCQLINESFREQYYDVLVRSFEDPVKNKQMVQKVSDELEEALRKSVVESMNSQGYKKYKEYYTDQKFNIYTLIQNTFIEGYIALMKKGLVEQTSKALNSSDQHVIQLKDSLFKQLDESMNKLEKKLKSCTDPSEIGKIDIEKEAMACMKEFFAEFLIADYKVS